MCQGVGGWLGLWIGCRRVCGWGFMRSMNEGGCRQMVMVVDGVHECVYV